MTMPTSKSTNPETWTERVRFYIDWLKAATLHPEDEKTREDLLYRADLGPRHPENITGKFHIEIINFYNKCNEGRMAIIHDFVYRDILVELSKAERKHPDWPPDLLHQISVMSEEAGEVVRAANQFYWEGGDLAAVRKELIQTAAMCFRCLINLPEG